MRGQGKSTKVEHLDPNGVFKGARRVALPVRDAEPALAAMRLENFQAAVLR